MYIIYPSLPIMSLPFRLDKVSRDVVLAMTTAENDMRISDEIQETYDRMHGATRGSEAVELYMQKEVLSRFGFDPSNEGIVEYQRILQVYGADKEIMDSVVYLRYSHLYRPITETGHLATDVKLYNLDHQQVSLFDLTNNGKPTVIMAGSIT